MATSSWIDAVEPTLTALTARGTNVVSICEELRDTAWSHAQAVARLDRLAREHGVSVLGTGCNPGMLMDTLPLVLSGLTLGVERVSVRRTADMSRYGAILKKFGLGLTPAEFDTERDADRVMGHVGFAQSIGALARGLEWELDAIEVDSAERDLITETERRGQHNRGRRCDARFPHRRGPAGGRPGRQRRARRRLRPVMRRPVALGAEAPPEQRCPSWATGFGDREGRNVGWAWSHRVSLSSEPGAA
ncbi:hypothetical protein ACIRNU_12255 [Streptomyces rochei]|uniref:hypothetical protein n=1 Tax=Streptomyces rochei TaxID=1928 RepID=UPI0037F7CDE4